MTNLFAGASVHVLNQLLLIIIVNLIPLLIWAGWDLEQRRRSWLSRRQSRHGAGRGPRKP